MASIPRFNVNSRLSKDSDGISNNSYQNDIPKTKVPLNESLGFGNIPEQMHRKAVKKGFNFTIMVVGESGLGKSTFINTLLMTDLYKDREMTSVTEQVETTTKIVKRFIELDEKGVKLRLTIIDTPGFGDAVNCENCWLTIEEYIDGAFEHYFKEECGLNRKNIQDNRIHCCLYFISPYGRGLRPIDITTIQRLQSRVNVVPVIAKADCLTTTELTNLKRQILADIDRHQLEIYRLPECDSDEEDNLRQVDRDIKSCLPFCVIGGLSMMDGSSNGSTNTSNNCRKYPWGSADINNEKHCDFTKLRLFLLKTHMQDLKDMTSDVLYENYRARCITERMNRRQTERHVVPGSTCATMSLCNGPNSIPSDATPTKSNLTPASKLSNVLTINSNITTTTTSSDNQSTRDSRSDLSEPGFEAIVDPENLLLHKEKEIAEMRQLCEKLQSQLQGSPAIKHPPIPPPLPPSTTSISGTQSITGHNS